MSFLMHQVSFLSQHLGIQGAAMAVSYTAMASIIARLLLGTVVDRLNFRWVSVVCFIIQGTAVLSLAYFHHPVVLYLGVLAFGFTMGNILMMQSLIIGECFGMVSFGTVSGIAGLFAMTGSAFGPVLAGYLFDVTGSYETSFAIFAAASFLACITIFFARPPTAK